MNVYGNDVYLKEPYCEVIFFICTWQKLMIEHSANFPLAPIGTQYLEILRICGFSTRLKFCVTQANINFVWQVFNMCGSRLAVKTDIGSTMGNFHSDQERIYGLGQ